MSKLKQDTFSSEQQHKSDAYLHSKTTKAKQSTGSRPRIKEEDAKHVVGKER